MVDYLLRRALCRAIFALSSVDTSEEDQESEKRKGSKIHGLTCKTVRGKAKERKDKTV
jgi:hypothetical protein